MIRSFILQVVTSKLFEWFIILVILLNSVTLGMADYSYSSSSGELLSENSVRNQIVEVADKVFIFIFEIECCLKLIGMGLIGEKG